MLTLEGLEAIVNPSKDGNKGFTNRKEKGMQELYVQEEKLGCRDGLESTECLQYTREVPGSDPLDLGRKPSTVL